MLSYFIKRILLVIPTVLIVVLVVFFLLGILPATDTNNMVRYTDMTGEESTAIFPQYLNYCRHLIFKLDSGIMKDNHTTNMQYIMTRFKETLKLTGLSLFITLAIGIPAGVISAVYQGKWQDNVLSTITVLISAFPAFCIALAVLIIMAMKLRWFHVIYSDSKDFFMPVFTLSLGGIATVCRMTRSSMLEVFGKQYIMALRSLGINRKSVILKHALKNALVPIISAFGLLIGQLLFGAIVVERFFNMLGIGGTLISAISSRHTAELITSTLVLAVFMCLLNILTDAVFLLVNPSMKKSFIGNKRLRSVRRERTS